MPIQKPHFKLNTAKQKEAPVKLKYNYGFDPDAEKAPASPKNYVPMAKAFSAYLARLDAEVVQRRRERNEAIVVPENIEYISINFFDQFVVSEYLEDWFNDFGLIGINFTHFNHQVLFRINDPEKFENFHKNIASFITRYSGSNTNVEYNGKVTYIKDFKLLTTADIIQYRQIGELMNVRLLDFPIDEKTYEAILQALFKYLESVGVAYKYDGAAHNLELINPSDQTVKEIVRNFDIVLSVTSALSTRIAPTDFNVAERSYGFEIENSNDELPLIGIIDTGISSITPLAAITLTDESFNLTQTSVLEDNAFNNEGHGTAVAALAALGKRPYKQNYQGKIYADAKLLSIKILDSKSGYISQMDVLSLLTAAKAKYPDLKIFVLTIGYDVHKRNNEDFSTYAYELDNFAHNYDCIILITTANNVEAQNHNTKYDLNYFFTEATNLCVPGDSMNNIIVGAAADSLIEGNFNGISLSKEFPALYSRKSHFDLPALFPITKINKHLFRPDVIECAGDYENHPTSNYIYEGDKASMDLLSANPKFSFRKGVGTSFAAPLVANIAAQIQRNYPNIKAQSMKALILNSASLYHIRFEDKYKALLKKTAGYGLVDEAKSVYSSDNGISFLIEDEITPEETKVFPLNFPNYLIANDLGKKNGILTVTATLCFSFQPLLNYQLGYCPVHIGFCFFKNQPANDIQKSEKEVKSLLKTGLRWSQTARHISKPIPFTNSQKITFSVNVKDLENEKCTFKLGVNSKINPQLLPGVDEKYKVSHPFSIAIRIEEQLPDGQFKGRLYDEIIACNEIEPIAILEATEDNELTNG